MTKAEHNRILEELFTVVQLGNFRDDVILMSQMMAADYQLQLMNKLMASLSPRQQAYQQLKAQVEMATENFERR